MKPQATAPSKRERRENAVQVLILLGTGGIAGAASFTHMHDWTMENAPHDTGDWFGWANAVVSDLIPIACALEIRRRLREGNKNIWYPLMVLLVFALLSLAAQVSQAKSSPSGWLLASIPAIGFLALTKLVLSTPARQPEPTVAGPAPQPQPDTHEALSGPVSGHQITPDTTAGQPDNRPDTTPQQPDMTPFEADTTRQHLEGETPYGSELTDTTPPAPDMQPDTELTMSEPPEDSQNEPDKEPDGDLDLNDMPTHSTAASIEWLYVNRPDWTQLKIAEHLGISERTVRRHKVPTLA